VLGRGRPHEGAFAACFLTSAEKLLHALLISNEEWILVFSFMLNNCFLLSDSILE